MMLALFIIGFAFLSVIIEAVFRDAPAALPPAPLVSILAACGICHEELTGAGVDYEHALGVAEADHCAATKCGGEPVDVSIHWRRPYVPAPCWCCPPGAVKEATGVSMQEAAETVAAIQAAAGKLPAYPAPRRGPHDNDHTYCECLTCIKARGSVRPVGAVGCAASCECSRCLPAPRVGADLILPCGCVEEVHLALRWGEAPPCLRVPRGPAPRLCPHGSFLYCVLCAEERKLHPFGGPLEPPEPTKAPGPGILGFS